jgi:glycosyltransferase involved in cell wall biosynthesis
MTSSAQPRSLAAEYEESAHPANSPVGKLHIAFVTPSLLEARGTERATAEMLKRLAAEHDVCLFLRDGAPPKTMQLCVHRIARVPGPGLVKFLSFYALATRAVRSAARKHRPYDAVYSPGPNCAPADVVSAHFCQARQLEMLRAGRHQPPAVAWLDRAKQMNRRLYAAAVSRLEKVFYSANHRRVVAPSRLLARDLIAYYGLSADHSFVAPLGVESEVFSPPRRREQREAARAELGLGAEDFVFLFLGNNWMIKGLLYALRALAEVPAAKLLVVGSDVERPQSWQRAAAECGVGARVRFLPRRSDVMFYYAAGDALVAPSVYDTFGLMPLEAAACGLPAIITRSMGVAEVLSEEEAIVLDRAEDVPALAAAMRRMREDSAWRQKLAERAQQRAAECSWDNCCRATLDRIASVARQRAALRERPPA